MAENKMKPTSGAVDQIIDNMTSDIPNADGQFIQLGFTPPPTPAESWNTRNKVSFAPQYHILNNIHNEEVPQLYSPVDQFNPQLSYNYIQQPGLYNTELYEKRNLPEMKNYYDIFQNMHNKPEAMYSQNHNWFMSETVRSMNAGHSHSMQQEEVISNATCVNNQCTTPNRSHVIDNLVGNWSSNTSGTYNPFGNMPLYNPNIFETQHACLNNSSHLEETNHSNIDYMDRVNEEVHFPFSRDKKPRIVAEVKPMRPSYSDVLLKSVPQTMTKSNRNEIKENKIRKESKKNIKNEKLQKLNNNTGRNVVIDSKEILADKSNHSSKNQEKLHKDTKPNQLNRKWSSLDNVTESFSDNKTNNTETSKTKKFEENINKSNTKINVRKITKNTSDFVDNSAAKAENVSVSKTSSKKNKTVGRPRNVDSFGNNDRPPGKRSQRNRKRESHNRFSKYSSAILLCNSNIGIIAGFIRQKLKTCLNSWWKIITSVMLWLINLICDICSLSTHLSKDL